MDRDKTILGTEQAEQTDTQQAAIIIGITTDLEKVAEQFENPEFGFDIYAQTPKGTYYAVLDEEGNLLPEKGLVLLATEETATKMEAAALAAMAPIIEDVLWTLNAAKLTFFGYAVLEFPIEGLEAVGFTE